MAALANAKPLLAFMGEVVTCDKKGHRLFRLTNNLVPGNPIQAADLKRLSFNVQKPVDKKRFKTTCECGGHWIKENKAGTGVQLHFSDGWRPE